MKFPVALVLLIPSLFFAPVLAQGPDSNAATVIIASAVAHNHATRPHSRRCNEARQ